MIGLPYKLAAVAACAFLVLMLALWGLKKAEQRGFDRAVGIYAVAAVKATAMHRATEQQWQTKSQEAQNESRKRQSVLNNYAIGLRTELGGLQNDLAASVRSMSEITDDAVRKYAATATTVLAECTKEYSNLAEDADRINSERQTLIEAWPTN